MQDLIFELLCYEAVRISVICYYKYINNRNLNEFNATPLYFVQLQVSWLKIVKGKRSCKICDSFWVQFQSVTSMSWLNVSDSDNYVVNYKNFGKHRRSCEVDVDGCWTPDEVLIVAVNSSSVS